MRRLTRETLASLSFVLRVLEKSKAWFYYRREAPRARVSRRPDVEAAIERIIRERPATYGYRRIFGMLIREGISVNPKTVWRIMRRRGWLSTLRSARLRVGRRHEGQVRVAKSNRRWASDITSIKAWNGEKGRLAIIIDCSDRSVLAWRWSKTMPSEQLQEMVREAVFSRFGMSRVRANGIEFLSDNGPEYGCHRLRGLLREFKMEICRTPRRSPESNGIAERFFGTLKKDYVYQGELENFAEIGRKMEGWIRDYNEVAPHSALGMKAPAKYYNERRSRTRLLSV